MSFKTKLSWICITLWVLYPPTTGLYFMLDNQLYLPGSSVNITDIGSQPSDRLNAGSTLVCVTVNVNTACCRNTDNNDNGAIGSWSYPNGDPVLTPQAAIDNGDSFSRIYYTQQVRLSSLVETPAGPVGVYTCQVPNENEMIVEASITLINGITVSTTSSSSMESITTLMPTTPPSMVTSVVISPDSPIGVAGETFITLTCSAMISGNGMPLFTWSGPKPRGTVAVQRNGNMYTDIFNLGRVRQSYEGMYTCTVALGDSRRTDSIRITVNVPMIAVTISQSGNPVALRTYTLTCTVSTSISSSLEFTSQSYIWIRNGLLVTGENNNVLDLSPLALSENNAVYRCQYMASLVYLNDDVNIVSAGFTLRVSVLPPSTPIITSTISQTTSVTLTLSQSSVDVITDYTISFTSTGGCPDVFSGSQIISEPPYTITGLEQNTRYEISVRARNSGGTSSAASTVTTTQSSIPTGSPNIILQSVSATSFTVIWEREPCLSRNGEDGVYRIRLRLSGVTEVIESSSVPVNSRIYTATSLNPNTSYTFEVAFVTQNGPGPYAVLVINTFHSPFHGYIGRVVYSNNSVVNLSDIGEGNNALYCYTNLTTCCRGSDNPNGGSQGLWRYPNDMDVPGQSMAPSTSFSRTRLERALFLHRQSSVTSPSGMFRCVIPDSNGKIQNIFFGIYNPNEAYRKGHFKVTEKEFNIFSIIDELLCKITRFLKKPSLTYNTTSGVLTCISTGGPATSVSWNRNLSPYQQNKILVDPINATYHNLLYTTSSDISDYTGNFTCTVSNERGTNITTEIYEALRISGVEQIYTTGSTALVTCYSNFTIQSIQWIYTLPDSAVTTTTMKISNELVLSLRIINGKANGTVFTCEAVITLPNIGNITRRNSFTLMTDETLPGPVEDFFIMPLSDSSLRISWMPPTMPNGVIITYNVNILKLDSNMEIISMNTTLASMTTFIATDLEPGIAYTVSVAVINLKGQGPSISEYAFTQELASRIPPKNIMISRTSETTMTVSWTKLTIVEARGFIRNYTIYYYPVIVSRKRQPSTRMYEIIGHEFNTANIGGLNIDSDYEVQMSATTSAGEGVVGPPIRISSIKINMFTNSSQSTDQGISIHNNIGPTVAAVVVSIATALIIFILIIIIVFLIFRQKQIRYGIKEVKKYCAPITEDRVYEEIDKNKTVQDGKMDLRIGFNKTENIDTVICVAYEEMKLCSSAREGGPEEVPSNAYETVQI